MYKLKVLYARPPMLLVYGPCFLLAQASLFCQHLKHVLWWLPQKLPEGLKRGEARNRLWLEEQAAHESHCFLQVRHLPQVCRVLRSISCATFFCRWVRMPTTRGWCPGLEQAGAKLPREQQLWLRTGTGSSHGQLPSKSWHHEGCSQLPGGIWDFSFRLWTLS